MIQLTRLNGKPLAVNADLIKFVEQSPDTVITLVTGEKLVVRESTDEVLSRIFEFRRLLVNRSSSINESVTPAQPAAAEDASGGERG
jgi:flagellar protein FlbD